MKGIALFALRGWSRATFIEATQSIKNAVELAPGVALPLAYLALVTALGAAVMMKRDDPAAAQLLAQGMDGSPADSRLSVWGTALSLARLAQGELDAALTAAANACKEDDRIYLPRLALAGIHLMRKEQPQAIAAVQEAIRTKPDLNQQEVVSALGERLGAGVCSLAQALLSVKQSL